MTIRLRPEASHVASGVQNLLFDQRTGSYFAVNTTATALIPQLTAGASPTELADTLASQYGIEQAGPEPTSLTCLPSCPTTT